MTTIGLLHPGEMGAAIGAELRRVGHEVLWAGEGRSAGTAARAQAAGLTDAGTAQALAAGAEVVLSVCPPAAAVETADTVPGFTGVYVDANAIAPDTARTIGATVERRGARFVDGGIVGDPPHAPGDVRLYLSGPAAAEVEQLFAGTVVEVRTLGERVGAASALKLAYAAWTKGSAALLLAAHRYALAEDVEPELRAEWATSQPELADRLAAASSSARAKGWRWVGEMREIAASFAAAGLPDGFHEAAAEIFQHPKG